MQAGDQVLVLLPSSTSKLQCVYNVVQQVNKANYCIRMHDKQKELKTYSNQLTQRVELQPINLMEEQKLRDEEEIPVNPVWKADARSICSVSHVWKPTPGKGKKELEKLCRSIQTLIFM